MNTIKLFLTVFFGSSLGTIFLEFVKDQIKESFSLKRDIKKNKTEKIIEKKIVIYEELYSKFDIMTSVQVNRDIISEKIEEIEGLIKSKNLYIDETMVDIAYRFSDYFKDIVDGSHNRDLALENSFLKEFKKEFNK